jgi:hypothetical protein
MRTHQALGRVESLSFGHCSVAPALILGGRLPPKAQDRPNAPSSGALINAQRAQIWSLEAQDNIFYVAVWGGR